MELLLYEYKIVKIRNIKPYFFRKKYFFVCNENSTNNRSDGKIKEKIFIQ